MYLIVAIKMIISGVFRSLGNAFRYFSSQAKINETNNLYGINSKQSLDAHVNYACNLIAENKIVESKPIFLTALNISKEINGLKTEENSDLIKSIAKSFLEIGEIESALQYYIEAYKIDSEILSKEDESLLDTANCIGSLYIELKQFKNTKDYLISIIPIIEQSNNNGLKGLFFHNLGIATKELDGVENALRYFLLAKSYQEKVNPLSKSMAATYNWLGLCYALLKNYPNAKENYLKSVEILEALPQENIKELMFIYIALGHINNSLTLEKEMHEYYEKAIQGLLTSNIENKNEQISALFINILTELDNAEDWKNSLVYLEKFLQFNKQNYGEESRNTADTYHKLSIAYLHRLKVDESLNFANKSLELRKSFKNNQNDLIESYLQYGMIYIITDVYNKAYDYIIKASEILMKFPNKMLKIDYDLKVASFYHSTRNYPLAETHMSKHIKGFKEENGENHRMLIDRYYDLGHIYKEMDNYDSALIEYHKALSLNEKINGKNNEKTVNILGFIGEVHRIKRNFKDALNFTDEAYKIKVKLVGSKDFSLQGSYSALARIYYDMNDYPNAIIHCHNRYELFVSFLGHDNPHVANCYDFLGLVYMQIKDKAKALENFQKSRSIYVKINDMEKIKSTDKNIEAVNQIKN